MEELLAERSAGIDRVVSWVSEANPTLDTLRLSPIQVAAAPPSLGAVLPALDSAVERLRRMESTVLERLETEGLAVAWAVAEYILTCFRSHDPRHSANSGPGWPRTRDGGCYSGRSARIGGDRGVPHQAPRQAGPANRRDPSGPPIE
jgi:hypothetical protein